MRQPHQAILDIQKDGNVLDRLLLAERQTSIGRAHDQLVNLPDSSVSRQHAEIFIDPFNRWWIRDLGSRNGTIVNRQKVESQMLYPGDVIRIGVFELQFRLNKIETITEDHPSTGFGDVESDFSLSLSDDSPSSISRLDQLASPKIDARHFAELTQFSTRLLTESNALRRLQMLCELLVSQSFRGESAAVLELNKTVAGQPEPRLLVDPVYNDARNSGEIYLSRTVLRAVLESESPIVASNTGWSRDAAIEMSLDPEARELSAVACPITNSSARLTLVYVTYPPEFGTGEWLALAALATGQFQQATEIWHSRELTEQQVLLERDLARAERIQNNLIPQHIDIPGLDVAIGFEPCKWVGGDYVDALIRPDGTVFLIVCDVCGKGLQAALIAASLHTMVHTIVGEGPPLLQTITRFNEYLCDMLPIESFVTGIGIALDPLTGQIECINAGHPPAMVIEQQGQVRKLQFAQNPPLGCERFDFQVETSRIEPGELLALFTDGLTESRNGANQMLGIDGVGEMLCTLYRESNDADAAAMTDRLTQQLNAYEGNALRADDRTFLLARRINS